MQIDGSVEKVVEGFTQAWATPAVERFAALLHPEVVLIQPVVTPIRGREAGRAEFSRLLRWLPDIRGTVDRVAVTGDTALVAWRLAFSLGGRPFETRIVDRLVVADGLIREREAYYDSARLVAAIVTRPSAWIGYLRYRGVLR